jgi:hypothetical protein
MPVVSLGKFQFVSHSYLNMPHVARWKMKVLDQKEQTLHPADNVRFFFSENVIIIIIIN